MLPTLITFAYLIGSISTAIIVCKLLNLPDPRTQGSNNPGATNVLRIGGKKAAAITLIGDGVKGAIPVLIAHRQEITLDIEMSADIKAASETDHIDQTLDYKAVSKRLIDFVKTSEFQLVETLAEKITQIIMQEFGVEKVKLTLNKGAAVTGAQGVGVIIERVKTLNSSLGQE
jgi:dihydroneopterin aldolase